MKNLMSLNLNNINLSIVGKPNSGKSTLFNTLLKRKISDVGDEYGLTKKLLRDNFIFNNYNFSVIDTPGLRRKSKVKNINEEKRNKEVIRLIKNVEVVVLLIDSIENVTKQDLRLADISINKKKLLFFIFNKIDIVQDSNKFKSKIKNYFKNNYSKYNMINIEFISAKKKLRIKRVLNQIIIKSKLSEKKLNKSQLNKFLIYLNKKGKYPKINSREIKPKYIVQSKSSIPEFKIFLNLTKKVPEVFKRFFENEFREFFSFEGVPIFFRYENSHNPYIN